MKRPIYFILFIFVTIIALSLVQIGTSNQISTAGSELAAMQQKVDAYKKENMVLQEKILEASSFTNISKKAEKLGYIPSKKEISLTTPLPLALR